MPQSPAPLFRELYELYQLTYFVYLAGDKLRAVNRNHPLLRYLRDLDTVPAGREFLREFADHTGDDPPLSVIHRALSRYHEAIYLAIGRH